MAKKYNVLWIDDEHEKLGGFKLQAAQNDIVLNSFKSRNAGIAELLKNYQLYDGVLFDAKFFEDEDDAAGSEDLGALNKAKESLLQLPKKFEMFVLTGQAQLFEDKTFNTFIPKYFRKGIAEDIDKLFTQLKQSADMQDDTQIRHTYQRVFEVCTEKYLGSSASKPLLSILKKENAINAFSDAELYFVPLRKVMEDLFTACHKYGFLPECFIKPSVALNETSKFLSGSVEKGYQLDTPVFIKVISEHVRNILSVCQPAAHRSEIDSFISTVNSPYLLLSTTYQLLDVLLWFKEYFDTNKDVVANKGRIKLADPDAKIEIIERDDLGNYHCGEVLLSYNFIKDNGFEVGEEIKLLSVVENSTYKTKHLYPKFANKIAKV